jgi:hypothetical protein
MAVWAFLSRLAGDADAGGDEHLVALDEEGLPEAFDQVAGQGDGLAGGPDVGDENGELVAPHPGHRVTRPPPSGDALGRLPQQGVAGGVTQ